MKKSALLVLDYINGIAAGNGSCAKYLSEHPEVIENTNTAIVAARRNNVPVIHVRLAFTEEYAGLPEFAPPKKFITDNKKFLLGTSDTNFIPEINFDESDHVLDKKYGDPFIGSGLEDLLKKLGVNEVVFAGVATDNAILYGAASAMARNLHVSVLVEACAAPTIEAHTNALALMKGRTVNTFLSTQECVEKFQPLVVNPIVSGQGMWTTGPEQSVQLTQSATAPAPGLQPTA